jgi:hypothetical protein
MKKTFQAKLLILNVLLAVAFTACNNNDDDDDTVDPVNTGADACQLVKAAEVGDDDYMEFEYNAQGYLTKAVYREVGLSATGDYEMFTYNADNRLIKLEYYENGQKDGNSTFEYTNDLLTTAKDYDKSGKLSDITTYKYDSNKRMIEQAADDEIYKYAYDAKNNLTKVERIYQGMVVSRQTFEDYDDKKSPYWAIKGFPAFLTESSPNNPGKTISTYDENQDGILQPAESETTTYTYKYNDKGYTTEVKENDGSDVETTSFTYNCR